MSAQLTADGRLVLGEAELGYLESLLRAGDRTGFYMAYYNMTGSEQAILQAQISSFSAGPGGSAYAANAMLQSHFGPLGNYLGVYRISQLVAESAFAAIRDNIEKDGGSGFITSAAMLTSAATAWNGIGQGNQFPGNLLEWPLHASNLTQPQVDEESLWEQIRDILSNITDPELIRNELLTTGAFVSLASTALGARLLGKRRSDYSSDSAYSLVETPDGEWTSVVRNSDGKTVAVVEDDPFIIDSWVEFFGATAEFLSATLLDSLSPLFSVLDVTLSGLRVRLTEHTPGFDGELYAHAENPPFVANPTPFHSDPTSGRDAIWGTDGLGGIVLADDDIDAGGGDDVMFGGDGDDTLQGGSGNDVVYGQADDDHLYGDSGDDVLRGGSGNDVLDGGDGDDVLDGEDNNPDTVSGNDTLYGGDGNDTLVGGDGADILYGGADSDYLNGGDGLDVLAGGEGVDTYAYSTGGGIDEVVDSDHSGQIVYDGTTLAGTGVYQSQRDLILNPRWSLNIDGEIFNAMFVSWRPAVNGPTAGQVGYSGDLFIYRDSGDSGLLIRDYTSGQFGLELYGTTHTTFRNDLNNYQAQMLARVQAIYSESFQTVSPLILDLDGDGVETIGIAQGVHFDHDANGFAEATGWAGADDGLLVLDRNGNGSIDSGRELFGNNTSVSSGYAANGFEALASMDVNHDGRIDSGDSAYAQLRVWRDANSNGVSDPGELLRLADAGVRSISLSYTDQAAADENNNQHSQVGQYTTTSGAVRDVSDVWFVENAAGAINTSTLEVGAAIAALPDISGSGTVVSLHDAMAQDTSGHLTNLVSAYVSESDPTVRASMLDAILFAWTGVEGLSPFSRGEYFPDARRLAALEAFMGRGFVQGSGINAGTTSPGPSSTQRLLDGYNQIAQYVSASLLVDSQLAGLFDTLSIASAPSGSLVQWDVTATVTTLQAAYALNPTTARLTMNEFAATLNMSGYSGMQILESLRAQGDPAAQGFARDLATLGYDAVALGTSLDDVPGIQGTANNEIIRGLAGADIIYGASGNDRLEGGDGNDRLIGGQGNDTLVGGAGDDLLSGGADYTDFGPFPRADGVDTYIYNRGDGHDVILQSTPSYSGHADIVQFGVDVRLEDLIFLPRTDGGLVIQFRNSEGNADPSGSLTIENYFVNEGLDRGVGQFLFTANGQTYTARELETALAQSPSSGTDFIVGTSLADVLSAGAGADIVHGLLGNDSLDGGEDADLLYGDSGSDSLYGGAGNDTLNGGDGADLLVGGTGSDILSGGSGSDVYTYNVGDGQDVVLGDRDPSSASIDSIQFGPSIRSQDVIVTAEGSDLVLTILAQGSTSQSGRIRVIEAFNRDHGDQILDEVRFNDGTIWNRAALIGQASVLTGSMSSDSLIGTVLDDLASGGAGNDSLYGREGNDTIVGGRGNDQLFGETGDDTYRFSLGDGFDEVLDDSGSNTIALDNGITPDAVTLIRSSSNRAARGAFASTADALFILVDGGSSQINVTNYFGAGTLPVSRITFADGTVWDSAAIASRVIDQSGLANSYSGTTGDDSYTIDHRSDVINESASAGTDTVYSSVSYTLPTNVENLTLTGSLSIAGRSNELINTIRGNDAGNVLESAQVGGSGWAVSAADTLIGGKGDDTYHVDTVLSGSVWGSIVGVDNFQDVVTEQANEGYDTIYAQYVYSAVLPTNVEALIVGSNQPVYTLSWTLADDVRRRFTGNSLDNLIDASQALSGFGVGYTSASGFDEGEIVIDGGLGADVMIGRNGSTRFIVDNINDVVIAGTSIKDTVQSSISYSLGEAAENLELSGSAAISGTGNDRDNRLDGSKNSAANLLIGGRGNDTYILSSGDTVQEDFGQGIDTVQAGFSYTLGANLENLTLTGGLFYNATGNELDNVLTGNTGDNTLNGGAGNDQLLAGSGNDRYVGFTLSTGADSITETSGSDTIQFSSAENIRIDQAQFSRSGNDLLMVFGSNSSLRVRSWYSSSNNVVEQLNIFNNGLSYTYNSTQMQALANGINSAPVFNSLAGQTSRATDPLQFSIQTNGFFDIESQFSLSYSAQMADGSALPTWLSFDSVTRAFSGTAPAGAVGTWSIRVTAADAGGLSASGTFNLVITPGPIMGTEGNDTLSGDASDNTIYGLAGDDTLNGLGGYDSLFGGLGNDQMYGGSEDDYLEDLEGGNDLLDGGTGADDMYGGTGNDIYVVDNTGDYLEENPAEGVDEVRASIAYVLSANLENLTLTGSSAINGTGNALDNVLTGNTGNNRLTGDAGNDTLNGGSGSDTMLGGLGDDTYVVAQTGDVVTENAGEGTDLVQSSITYTLGNNLENLTLTGTSAINGTGNTLDNILTGNSANNTLTGNTGNDTLNGSGGTDTMVGGAGNDIYYVDVSADVTTENANEGIDTVNSSVTRTLANNIELLFLTGTSAINGTGNTLNNLLRGNTVNNTLAGAAGVDILEGGAGNDTLSDSGGNTLLNGGAGTDTLTGTANNDLLIGGTENDALTTGSGADIIAFNLGDGQDTVAVSTTRDNTISIGGGAAYADLLFTKNGNDLILKVGATDQITLTGYYASTSNRSVNTLQMIVEGSSDYSPGSGDTLRDNKIETFNFEGLVAAFDAARTANPNLTSWALSNALLAQHLSGSDTAALGGDLAYRYGRVGNLSEISFTPALGILSAASFGTGAQTLQALATLQDSSARLTA